MMEQLFFLAFAVVAVISALAVVGLRNPVHAALSLMVCLFQVACLFVLLRSPFLAVVQIFIYVGATMVIFLFVVMLFDVKKTALEPVIGKGGKVRGYVYFLLVAVTVELLAVLAGAGFKNLTLAAPGEEVTIEVLGRVLFTEYLLPFELVSVLLLIAMVGAIILAKEKQS
jgi:NADH-quinone oxidoreductase subunit J